jgi:RecA/RadA recombinase
MMANDLLAKMKAAGSIKAATLSESEFFNAKDFTVTDIPVLNAAFSGSLDGGMTSGLTMIAGESKNFKTGLGLVCVAAYMKKHSEAICLLYDSEFGITKEYIESHGIDTDRVIHIPVEHMEQLKFDMVKRLEQITRGDKIIILVDSIGNLASRKEVDDALDEKSVADMSRAKQLKSLFRMITPHFTMKDIPCIVINHTYKEIGMFPKDIVGGGTGSYYSANTIFIIGRSQEKEGTEVTGWNFTLRAEKSRYVKEKSKFPIQVMYDEGINRYSGLMDLALESGHVIKPKNGWYCKTGEDKNHRLGDTNTDSFWGSILDDITFKDWIKSKFMLTMNKHTEE